MMTSKSVVTGYLAEGFVTLFCQVQGYFTGLVQTMWARGTTVLTNSSKYSTGYSEELLSSTSGFDLLTITLALTIKNLNTEDERNYTCIINDGQEEAFTITLLISPLPREPIEGDRRTTTSKYYLMNNLHINFTEQSFKTKCCAEIIV